MAPGDELPIVLRRADGTVAPAVVRVEIDEESLEQYVNRWRTHPNFALPPGGEWDWTTKPLHGEADERLSFAVRCDGDVQGLMLVCCSASRATESLGNPLVEVEYIQVAPWNLGESPKFQWAGTGMLAVAARRSVEQGCDGRLGLHDAASKSGFYAGVGFEFVGIDPANGFSWMELDPTIAARVVRRVFG